MPHSSVAGLTAILICADSSSTNCVHKAIPRDADGLHHCVEAGHASDEQAADYCQPRTGLGILLCLTNIEASWVRLMVRSSLIQ